MDIIKTKGTEDSFLFFCDPLSAVYSNKRIVVRISITGLVFKDSK